VVTFIDDYVSKVLWTEAVQQVLARCTLDGGENVLPTRGHLPARQELSERGVLKDVSKCSASLLEELPSMRKK